MRKSSLQNQHIRKKKGTTEKSRGKKGRAEQNVPFASSDSGTAANNIGRCITGKARELWVGRCCPDTRSNFRSMHFLAQMFI